MIGYIFNWTGSKDSLLGVAVTTLIIVDTIESKMESIIPVSSSSIYSPKKDISNFFRDTLASDYIITHANELNNEGDYAIYKNKRRLLYRYPELIGCSIYEVRSIGNWVERLSIIYAIKCWERQLKLWDTIYNSINGKSFLALEKNKKFHKEHLLNSEVLLPIYSWYKVINLFKDDSVKPKWYKTELEIYKKLIGEL